jgi:Zn-dependent protease
MNLEQIAHAASVWVLPVLFAITLHEAAHGFVAWHRGDDTAYMLGRVNFNPLRHIDPIGTILVPAILLLPTLLWGGRPFLFGWAKPVPVNFRRLHRPKQDMVWVAIAGPGVNIALAYVSAVLLHLLPLIPGTAGLWVGQNLLNSVQINLVLAVFNMIPLPPLDGGRVAVGLLPRRIGYALSRVEPFGFMIIIALLFLTPQLNLFQWLVGVPVSYLSSLIALAAGH